MDELPETRYARVDGLRIAYQRFGSGAPVVMIPGLISNVDLMWEHEYYRRVFDHVAQHCDWIQFDKRGMGLSDRFDEPPTIEERIGDIVAVMDDAGMEQATIVGLSEGGAMARQFAVAHPQRVRGVALLSTMVDAGRTPQAHELSGERWVPTAEIVSFWLSVADTWGEDASVFAARFVPSQADNAAFVRWLNRLNRMAATPAAFARQLQSMPLMLETIPDVPAEIPTLIVHGEGDRILPVGHGRALAAAMPHATYVECEGDDHFQPALPNWRDYVDPVIEFASGVRPTARTERRFATVLFTDIVGSTQLAGSFGDDRWAELIDSHDRIAHRTVAEHGGRVVKSTGDGILATFDVPSRAVEATARLRGEIDEIGLSIRSGLHAGEVEVHGNQDVTGLAVNLAARIEAQAGDGEILVSSTVKDLLLGSPVGLVDRGAHSLKGIEGSWQLFAVA